MSQVFFHSAINRVKLKIMQFRREFRTCIFHRKKDASLDPLLAISLQTFSTFHCKNWENSPCNPVSLYFQLYSGRYFQNHHH